jgi:dihydroxy-acid dehydratase
MRLNIPVCSSPAARWRPARSSWPRGRTRNRKKLDLIDAMVMAADDKVSDEEVAEVERSACPTCGSCSGMFTANSMNCLTEALGLSLPGNGTVLATHADREQLFLRAGPPGVELCKRYYEQDDASVLPRSSPASRRFRERDDAGHRHGRLDQHHPAPAGRGAGGRRRLHHGRHRPHLAQGAPAVQGGAGTNKYHIEDVHRAGGIMGILGELDRAACCTPTCPPCTAKTLGEALDRGTSSAQQTKRARPSSRPHRAACRRRCLQPGTPLGRAGSRPRRRAVIRSADTPSARKAAWPC